MRIPNTATLVLSSLLAFTGAAASGQTAASQAASQPASQSARPSQATPGPDIERFLRIRTPSAPKLAPDGTVYLRDWPDGIYQLYKRDAGEAPGATGEQLTEFPDGISGFSVSPDGSRIIVEAGVGGSEQDDLFLLDPDSGEVRTIKSNPGVVYSAQAWAPDGTAFLFTANDQSPGDFHIYRYDMTNGRIDGVLRQEGYWYAAAVSEDGDSALVGRYYSASSSEAHLLNMREQQLTDLSVRDDEGTPYTNSAVGFLPGGNDMLIVSDHVDGKRLLYRVGRTPGQRAAALPARLQNYEVDNAEMNEARTHLAVTLNEDGYGRLYVFELPSMREVELPKIEPGVVSIADFSGTKLVYSVSNARSAGVSYAWDVSSGGEPKPLTVTDDAGIDLSAFTLPTLIRYESFDGTQIPAFLYTPPGYTEGEPIPFVISYHGGPEGQHRPGFSATTQYYLAAGYGVMLPNVRGSTGFGREFHQMDNYTKRWDSVKDGVAAAEWLVDNGYAQPGRIAATGGSYGGFMACAVPIEDYRQTQASGREAYIGAAIDVVGIVNFQTFLEQTKDYRRKLREAEYGPLSDPEFLASVSPIHFIDEIKVPMLIAHGLNDPRVPVGEAMQLAVGLQARGLDPVLVFFPDEGHGFRKLDNRLVYFNRVVKFLDETIGAGADDEG